MRRTLGANPGKIDPDSPSPTRRGVGSADNRRSYGGPRRWAGLSDEAARPGNGRKHRFPDIRTMIDNRGKPGPRTSGYTRH